MDILSFSRMKSYRKDGRIAVILKLRLPRTDGSCDKHSVFDSFYSMLADRYASITESAPCNLDGVSRPTTVSVDYTVVTDLYIENHPKLCKKHKNIIVIRREERVNISGEIRRREFYDLFDIDEGIFIK